MKTQVDQFFCVALLCHSVPLKLKTLPEVGENRRLATRRRADTSPGNSRCVMTQGTELLRLSTHMDDETWIWNQSPGGPFLGGLYRSCNLSELHAHALALGQQHSGTAHQRRERHAPRLPNIDGGCRDARSTRSGGHAERGFLNHADIAWDELDLMQI